MSSVPTLVFVHGGWHRPSCYDKLITILQDQHNIKCIAVSLPSVGGSPLATFKDNLDVTREAIASETKSGRDVVVVAHSYGGMVGNSAVKGFTRNGQSSKKSSHEGHVIGIVLIASGYTLTGLAFMDPFLGHPPPSWKANKETGYADLVAVPQDFFYHDLPRDEADYWTSQLTTQSLKALFEGGGHSYAGWQDVPSCYIGTIEDQGLPVLMQRINVGFARGAGATVEHRELMTSHSAFLSQPDEVADIILDAIQSFTSREVGDELSTKKTKLSKKMVLPCVTIWKPFTLVRFGLPLFFGHILGRAFLVYGWMRRLWTKSK